MKTRLQEMAEQADDFHKKHPEIWEKFVEFTFDRINRGYPNYSVKAIFERIRWDMGDVGGDGVTEFKVGNNHPPFYARRFMKMYPEHNGFFRTRVQKSAVMPATGMEAKPSMVA
jgi:hypothetical protein